MFCDHWWYYWWYNWLWSYLSTNYRSSSSWSRSITVTYSIALCNCGELHTIFWGSCECELPVCYTGEPHSGFLWSVFWESHPSVLEVCLKYQQLNEEPRKTKFNLPLWTMFLRYCFLLRSFLIFVQQTETIYGIEPFQRFLTTQAFSNFPTRQILSKSFS